MKDKSDRKPVVPAINTEKVNLIQQLKDDDVYALTLLQPLLISYPFLPFTHASLRPFCLAHILNDIIINNRQSIVEFGSGISTLIIGRLIKKNHLTTKLLSIEHNEGWMKTMGQILKNEQIDDVVTIKWAPLTTCKLAIDNNLWYDIEKMEGYTKNEKFDMVIVDGPPAWEPDKQIARFPAVPFIKNKLGENFSIYLDDANRVGEQRVIEIWKSRYDFNFNFTGKSFAYHSSGNSFYTDI